MPYGQVLAILCLAELLRAYTSMATRSVRLGHYIAYGATTFSAPAPWP